AGLHSQNLQTYTGCDSTVNLTLTVNQPAVTNINAAICQGETYSLNGFNVSTAGLHSQNLQTYTGCDSTVNLTLTVNPIPTVNFINNLIFCHGEQVPSLLFTGSVPGTSYKWRRIIGQNLGLLQSEGFDSLPSFTAINQGIAPIFFTYSVTPSCTNNGVTCYGEPTNVLITVNPLPRIALVDSLVFCNGTYAEEYTLTGDVPGTLYKWERVGGNSILGLLDSGMNNIPTFNAINNGLNPLLSLYSVTSSYTYSNKTCHSPDTSNFAVVILPTPSVTLTPSHQTICSNQIITPIIFTGTNNTRFEWTRVSGSVDNILNNGIGDMIGVKFQNNGISPIEIVYSVKPVYNYYGVECEGESQIFSITVNPSPKLTSPLNAGNICSGNNFVYTASTNRTDGNFIWNRLLNPYINGGSESSGISPFINEILINNSNQPEEVNYILIVNSSGCSSLGDTVKVIVNPNPEISINYINNVCPGDTIASISYTTNIQIPISYKIGFDELSLNAGFVPQINYTTISSGEVLVPMPRNLLTGIYRGTLYITNGSCEQNYDFAINVLPKINILTQPVSQYNLCPGISEVNLSIEVEALDNYTYQWYRDGIAISGATNATYITNFDTTLSGHYYVEINSSFDCNPTVSTVVEVLASELYVEKKWDDVLAVNNVNDEYISYQWYRNGVRIINNGTSQYYTDLNGLNGDYFVRVTTNDGQIIESCPVHYENTKEISYKLYPNPSYFGQTIFVEVLSYEGDFIIDVYNMLGLKLLTMLGTNKIEINSLDLTIGSYLVKITTSKGVEFKKFIIQK
ncbi:MAG: PKD-like domain-containing protein, partial [Bacteroidales bacterium]